MSTNYGLRPVVVETDGIRTVEEFNFDEEYQFVIRIPRDEEDTKK